MAIHNTIIIYLMSLITTSYGNEIHYAQGRMSAIGNKLKQTY